MKTFPAFRVLFVPLLLAAPLFAQEPRATTPPPSPFRLSSVSGAPLAAEQEKEALEFLLSDANDRTASERQLHTTRTRAPEVYWAHLRSALSHKQQMAKLKAEDSQRYELYQREQQLHRKADLLTAQYRAAKTDATREKARSDLKSTLSELFDVREHGRLMAEVARLQREIKQEQDRTAQRRSQKETIVEEELKRFTATD